MHTLLHLALILLADPSGSPTPTPTKPLQIPSPPDSTFRVAIVGAIGLVLATSITAIASTFKRDSSARPQPGNDVTRRYIAGLEKDRRDYGRLRDEYAHLREACIERDLNPDQMIHEQEQRA